MDVFEDHASSLVSPARDAQAVTPSDTLALDAVTRGVYVGQTGALSVQMAGGQVVVFQNLPTGSLLPIRASHIRATGTTATGLVALW